MCPLCRQRKARRACPALRQNICPICCGTKRLVEIACPDDCPYLATAREHPPATVLRQHHDDVSLIVRAMRDLNERQSRLAIFVLTSLVRYQTPELQPLIDEDVADAVAALAATNETAARGVVYEHRPAAAPAERLRGELAALLSELAGSHGTIFQRDAAVVLRRVELAAREAMRAAPGQRRAFLEIIHRVVPAGTDDDGAGAGAQDEAPRLIIP